MSRWHRSPRTSNFQDPVSSDNNTDFPVWNDDRPSESLSRPDGGRFEKSVTATTTSTFNEDPVQWRISLYTPTSMVALFISGILVAIGHHLFYSRFHGNPVENSTELESQTWIIRYGTAFAFVAKTLLAGAVVIAYKQHMWINLRRKGNTISTIDAMFAATHDFIAFLSPSLFLRAKIPALMALVTW